MRHSTLWKLFALFISLLLCFIIIQQLLISLFNRSIPFAIVLSLFAVSLLLTFLLKKGFLLSDRDILKPQDERNFPQPSTVQEISKEKDYLQTVLKGMAEGVLVVDERGRIQLVNESLRHLFPLPREIVGRTLLETIRHAELEKAIRQAIQEGKGSAFELTLPTSPGKFFDVNVVPIPPSFEMDRKEQPVEGAIAVFHDISRLKELEGVRQDFVANVSHELRTPLTTIKGYTETLLEGALKEDVAFQFVQVIKKHADRLTKIVEELLMLSRIESKEFRLNKESLPLQDLVGDVIGYLREAAEKKGISILRGESIPSLRGEADRSCLEQVLINLIDNAIKYTPEGGGITISVIENEGREIEFCVRDNGIGIPKEDIPRIFERFYRVDKGRSQESGGTGLGLSIVKHLVQAHGGKVWVESRPGEGSTFYFTLPSSRA